MYKFLSLNSSKITKLKPSISQTLSACLVIYILKKIKE